ncbi:TPA: hypothetical protein K7617_004275 [Salmonella enterica]|nr:hypothetical protein [Salmonella enterica]
MNDKQEINDVAIVKWVFGIIFAVVIIGMPTLGFFKFVMLLISLTITIGTVFYFGSITKNKDNKIPMMILGGFVGIIISAGLVLYNVHERNEMCSSDFVPVFCSL